AIGEEVDLQALGGAKMHAEVSGTADYTFKTEQECLDQVRRIISKTGAQPKAGYDRTESKNPAKQGTDIYSLISVENNKDYDIVDVIQCIVDEGSFDQFKEEYGKTIVCGYAR